MAVSAAAVTAKLVALTLSDRNVVVANPRRHIVRLSGSRRKS